MNQGIFDSGDATLFDVRTKQAGPTGQLPITPEMLIHGPSGDLFGWTQDVGMGWDASKLGGPEVLILSTHGGVRAPDGSPVALGYHTGHWEVGLLVEEAAREVSAARGVPFAGAGFVALALLGRFGIRDARTMHLDRRGILPRVVGAITLVGLCGRCCFLHALGSDHFF